MGRKQKLKEQKKVETNKNISRAIREKDKGTLYYIIYIGLIILLLYPPYFRGMFFDKEFLPTHIYSGVLFLLYLLYKIKVLKEQQFFKTPMDYAALALVGAYFLSVFAAVNMRSAVGEFLKYINYFIVFYMVSDFARTEKDIRVVLWAMVLSAFGVAFVGIGAAASTFTYNGAFVGGRINSTLQYPNTLAAYLTAAFMIAASLWATGQKRWQKGILAFINYTILLCFIFTLSRGAWLMFPALFLIFILGMPGQYRMKALSCSIQTFISAAAASPGFSMAISANRESLVWLWYLAGAVLSIALFYIIEKISEHFALRIRPKVALSVFVVLIILGGLGAYAALTTEAPLAISHSEDEEASWKTSWYPIKDVKPDTEYTLRITLSAKPGKTEEEWGGAIFINSIDENSSSVRIMNEHINENLSKETREVTFTTRPDTKSLSIGFSNYFPDTKATFYDAEFFEAGDAAAAKHIILAYKYIPESISRRIMSISTEDSSFTGRVSFYRDALKIIKDHPVLGTGGGGWKSIYQAYQSYRYFTTEVHNFFLQLWVETGTIGILALAALLLCTAASVYTVYKVDGQAPLKTITWGAFAGAAALLGHSAMDFNLSLGAVAFYLWQLLGVIRCSTATLKPQAKAEGNKGLWQPLPLGGLACILAVLGFLLYQGYTYSQQAVKSVQEQDIMQAREYFEKAAKYDPYTASYKADLAQLDYFIARQTEDDGLLKKSEQMRLEAVKLDPYNAMLRTQLAAYYLENGRLDEGISELEKSCMINPFNSENWENRADAYLKTAIMYLQQEQKQKALELTAKSQELFNEIFEYNARAPKSARDKLDVTNELMLYIYKSKLLAENIDDKNYYKTLDNLIFASDFTIDADNDKAPDLWRIYNSQNGLLEVSIDKNAAKVTNRGEEPSHVITKNDITLEPNTDYMVNLAVGSLNPETKPIFNIFSRKGKNPQHQQSDMGLNPEITNISSTFTTTEDIEDGAAWLRIDIPENTRDAIYIKAVEIWHK
ncbi:O-antigen polymerase [Tepidanaerobacter acetatoxydans Re1]|uniref:O-antigen polymerase n=1 Tax=Tepidanaerobacter acetatoxydans (strain DSM 21804 / JCM 16047 / Re1) TaxID=1209989 RepID=F4LXB0_TEPAE|nr:O-antigen ligase family protein [Tepidanaerobacter acetatoxydans]AEE91909.1 O-antigen polymerase [Tepidanaerobacter acetatoxydans Re1]CDI40851.1 O-antigen polymerase [Tepidanaerobacter acetatoxydans Re1]